MEHNKRKIQMKYILFVLATLIPLLVHSQDQLISELENRKAPNIPSSNPRSGRSLVIKVSTQEQFDNLQNTLSSAIKLDYARVSVRFSAGTFLFRENQINLTGVRNTGISLSFVGDHTIIRAADYVEGIDRGMSTEVMSCLGRDEALGSLCEIIESDGKNQIAEH